MKSKFSSILIVLLENKKTGLIAFGFYTLLVKFDEVLSVIERFGKVEIEFSVASDWLLIILLTVLTVLVAGIVKKYNDIMGKILGSNLLFRAKNADFEGVFISVGFDLARMQGQQSIRGDLVTKWDRTLDELEWVIEYSIKHNSKLSRLEILELMKQFYSDEVIKEYKVKFKDIK